MLSLLIVLVVVSVVSLVYLRWSKVKRYWSDRGVPYIPPNLLLGNLTFLQRYNSGIWMKQIYRRSKTPYVGIWLFWRPALIVNSTEIGRRVLIKDAAVFRDRFVTSGSSDPIGKNNLFTVKGPVWTSLRRRLTLVFTSMKLRNMHTLIDMKTKQLLQRIDNDMKKNQSVNLRAAFTDYTTDVIGAASFGYAGDATLTGKGILRQVTTEFMTYDVFRGISWVLMFFWPTWVNFFRLSAFPKSSTDALSKVYYCALRERGGYGNKVTETRDLLDALIKIKQDCIRENEDMPDETLIAQAAVFVQGGFDTTATILSWCIYELTFNPDVQENLYRELSDGLGNPATDIHIGNLCNLIYMNAVIEETLRKYVPMGWMDRVASQDYRIDDQLTVPAGMPVYVNVVGIQYDPDIYPDPDKFDPGRFINNPDRRSTPVWTFGEGPRSCIGRRFALINIRCAIAYIIVNYTLRPKPSTPHPLSVQVDKRSLFYSPGEPLLIDFQRRN